MRRNWNILPQSRKLLSETPDNVRTSRIVPSTYEEIKKFMRRRQAFNHPTVMYKKSKVMECGGYSNL